MNNKKRSIYGFGLTVLIYLLAIAIGKNVHLNNEFIVDSVVFQSCILLASISAIFLLKNSVNYRIAWPRIRHILKPIVFAIGATVVISILTAVATKLLGQKPEGHPLLLEMSPLQVFIFVFIYASIAEELLFRGFLMNIMSPLKEMGITLFKRKISLPVIVSAVLFGLAHLILIVSGAELFFLIRVVLFATILGLLAGYYQEKYTNNAYAIIVHMSANSLAVLASVVMNLNV